jgi:hypothetical protein
MKMLARVLGIGLLLALPSAGLAQQVDRSAMDQWLQSSEHQGSLPVGTKIRCLIGSNTSSLCRSA